MQCKRGYFIIARGTLKGAKQITLFPSSKPEYSPSPYVTALSRGRASIGTRIYLPSNCSTYWNTDVERAQGLASTCKRRIQQAAPYKIGALLHSSSTPYEY